MSVPVPEVYRLEVRQLTPYYNNTYSLKVMGDIAAMQMACQLCQFGVGETTVSVYDEKGNFILGFGGVQQ